MSRQEIRLGTVGANGRDGDDNRTSFGKINEMTTEIYGSLESLGTSVTNLGTTVTNLGTAVAGLGTAAHADIVGTMTAGAIIEKGSNANGSFVRFADGTQITWGRQNKNAAVAAGTAVAWDEASQPAPFLAGIANFATHVHFEFWSAAGQTGQPLYSCNQSYSNTGKTALIGINMGISPSAAHPSFTYGVIAAASYTVQFMSVGRWK